VSPLDNLALYRLLGGLFGRAEEAESLCVRFQAAHDALLAAQYSSLPALYLIWKDPWMTVSRDTYISRTLALAGLVTLPVDATARYPEFSMDAPWVRDAQLILLSSEPYMFRVRHVAELSHAFPERPVHLIDGEMTSWYGSRAIEGLAYLRDFRRSIA
jgi:ABC-type Fe3+-hydroxamate transport system substrate-binding protein